MAKGVPDLFQDRAKVKTALAIWLARRGDTQLPRDAPLRRSYGEVSPL